MFFLIFFDQNHSLKYCGIKNNFLENRMKDLQEIIGQWEKVWINSMKFEIC